MSTGAQKLAWAGLAVCAFVAAALVTLPAAQMGLVGLGSMIVGKIGLRRPGDVSDEPPRFKPPKSNGKS